MEISQIFLSYGAYAIGIVAGIEIMLLFFIVYLFIKVREIFVKKKALFSGKNGKDLEEIIQKNIESIKTIDGEIQELYNISNEIHKLSTKSIQRVEVERFNPFKDIGGDQSFSVALLNGKNSGVVISSLHTREGTRVYAKPIQGGKSEKYLLTEEEKSVIKKAAAKK